ncbi:hypothetical protein [Pseudomonas aeruginosa]|jgi:hypothetical protein|uniref:hypothetical protein n=1 Tax=Pseudomonas aeruginosa TaxID=287 RepID=UPI00094707F8|nr:hypothetical protein [Pseudomonas aeruginosa]
MKNRLVKVLATAGLGVALAAGGAVAAPAQAAPQVWYWVVGSQAQCSAKVTQYRGLGAVIWTGCHKRSYDGQWAFSYYWPKY